MIQQLTLFNKKMTIYISSYDIISQKKQTYNIHQLYNTYYNCKDKRQAPIYRTSSGSWETVCWFYAFKAWVTSRNIPTSNTTNTCVLSSVYIIV